MIEAIEHREKDRELVVHLDNGETKHYHNVSTCAYAAFVTAPNWAAYYLKYIQPVYRQVRDGAT